MGHRVQDPYSDPKSLRFRLRKRRFSRIKDIIDQILRENDSCNILDVGGTEKYWQIAGEYLSTNRERINIFLLNLGEISIHDASIFSSLVGDACDLSQFSDGEFDFVHSNSVIEHVGSWERMRRFAEEVMRVGKRQYIQTPNMWFPIEPHFRFIGFQWLPESIRASLLCRKNLGFHKRANDFHEAMSTIQHTYLLTPKQFFELFPNCNHASEKILGFNKSMIADR